VSGTCSDLGELKLDQFVEPNGENRQLTTNEIDDIVVLVEMSLQQILVLENARAQMTHQDDFLEFLGVSRWSRTVVMLPFVVDKLLSPAINDLSSGRFTI
jgi:hypothetical protein